MPKRNILWAILLPTLLVGIAIALLTTFLLSRPIIRLLQEKAEYDLTRASAHALFICDERLSDLMDLRLENDPSMNQASKREAIEEIRAHGLEIPGIETLVVEEGKKVIGASLDIPPDLPNPFSLEKATPGILSSTFQGEPVRIHSRYFPFWRWHVVSLISEAEFRAPVTLVHRAVALGTFGVLAAVLGAVLLVFYRRINRPLGQIINATREFAGGKPARVTLKHPDEIGQVAAAFNAMVSSLERDQEKIRSMMAELKDSEERYRVLTEHAVAYIAMVQRGRVTYANPRMLALLGDDAEASPNQGFTDSVHPEDRQTVQEKMLAIESGKDLTGRFECRFSGREGNFLWMEVLASPVLFKGDRAILIHAVDVTARKNLEERLSRAQKMEAVGALAGGVAHDLNNVLGGLVTYPELLLMDLPQDSPLRKPLLTIQKSGEKAAAIVQDMLTLARRGVAVAEVVDLNEIVSEYLKSPEFERLKAFHPGVDFESRPAPDALCVEGSPVHLSKTVMNLVSNAAESMPTGGTTTLSTENRCLETPLAGFETIPPGEYVVLSVSDTGIGISPADLKKIFEPFYTKKVMGRSGTGLGMAVVQGTVKDLHGNIDILANSHRGTRFDLYFPASRKPKQGKRPPEDLDRLKGNESVLVVDDVAEQREVALHILKGLGYQVEAVSSGEEAVARLAEAPVDLLVLDMIMDPGMDGLETFRKVLDLRPGQKAIIASGFSETERVSEAQRLGAGAYVKKPYTLQSLGLAVRTELNQQKAEPVKGASSSAPEKP